MAGGVKCWGYNNYGQLGNGTIDEIHTPRDVTGLSIGVAAISSGHNHSCALTTSGGVKCWGANGSGQLGDGSNTSRSKPVDVFGLSSGVAAISASYYHTCALTKAGGIKCWGYNRYGQIGDGSTMNQSTPATVAGLASGMASVSAGYDQTCAVTTAGGMKCWGHNGYGELGNGTAKDSATPVDVSGLAAGVASISAGNDHTCAVTTLGGLKCWGFNNNGQVGDGTTTSRTTPGYVLGLSSGVVSVSAGNQSTCSVTAAGGLKCCGSNNYGQLGDGSTTLRMSPVDVFVTTVSAGEFASCARTAAGAVKCWGDNSYGRLGDGTTITRATLADVAGLSAPDLAVPSRQVAAGESFTCVLTLAGEVKCWGRNDYGQLGIGSSPDRTTPAKLESLVEGVNAIAAGAYHSCALTTSGGVKCWGRGSNGQIGDGFNTDKSMPTDVYGLSAGIAAISTGYYHSCALSAGGGVKCWGYNGTGQLGDGTGITSTTPVDVRGLTSDVLAVSSGAYHTCALTSVGGVKCWGENHEGRLGDGTTTSSTVPVEVPSLKTGVLAVSAGSYHTCALTTGGGVKCWGLNNHGQLGDGTTTSKWIPIDASGLATGITSVTAGLDYTCALGAAGGVKCWGLNNYGQLGDGSTSSRLMPVDVSGLIDGVVSVTAGKAYAYYDTYNYSSNHFAHTCAVTTKYGVKCWGVTSGALGDGDSYYHTTPADMIGLSAPFSPACTLGATPAVVSSGNSSMLAVSCNPAASSYVWTNSGFGGATASGSVKPFFTTTYYVQGVGDQLPSAIASATVTVTDTVALPSNRSNYTIINTTNGYTVTDNVGTGGTLTFGILRRVRFADISIAFDTSGVAGEAYRLYQAAFNRAPDTGGLGFQMWAIELHGSTLEQVAQNFIDSPEFTATYGAATDLQFVTLLYSNVLKRAPDAGGQKFYLDGLASKAFTRAKILSGFSESPENQALVLPAIKDGILYMPTGGN